MLGVVVCLYMTATTMDSTQGILEPVWISMKGGCSAGWQVYWWWPAANRRGWRHVCRQSSGTTWREEGRIKPQGTGVL